MSVDSVDIGTPEFELQTWALRDFERIYHEPTHRVKASRQDFWHGYRAALVELKAWDHFRVRPVTADA